MNLEVFIIKVHYNELILTKRLCIRRINFMSLDLLPSIFVPLVGLVLPLFATIALFLYIEKENREVFDPTTYKF